MRNFELARTIYANSVKMLSVKSSICKLRFWNNNDL
jgi:hypothetical protein